MHSSKRKILTSTAAFLLAAALPLDLVAQTVGGRPGSTARGTNRGATATRTTTSSGGANRSSTGQRQYRSNTELGDATIQIDPETRSLVIVTDDETNLELEKVIKMLDRPKPQVLIKVVFVEVTYNKDSDIGVEASIVSNWGGGAQGATTGTQTTNSVDTFTTPNGGTKTVTSNSILDLAKPAVLANGLNGSSFFNYPATPEGAVIKVLADDWSATIHALQQKGKLEVISRPSIMARNNQEAVIVIGSEVPFVTNSQITNLGQTINTITYDNVGVILRVTPFITSEGTVEMIVAPEISTLTDQTVPISNTASAPVIAKRSAETVVVTPNGRTVVIGGLMQTQKTESIRKIPLLGDIPVVGAAFRRTITGNEKKELLIFLTPYIVNSPEGMDKLSHNEVDRTQLVERAFTPDEFGRYVDDSTLFPETLEPQDPTEMEVRRATVVKKTTTTTTRTVPAATTTTQSTTTTRKPAAKATPAPAKRK